MLNKLFVAVLAAAFLIGLPAEGTAAPADACKIVSPPEGWPGGGNPGYNTRLQLGHNNDWPNQLRPIGDVKAIMLFVDFPNAGATETTAPYYNNLVPGATQFFNTVSYGQFRLTVDAPSRWYRMSKNHQDYGMGYIVSPAVQAVYIDEAMRIADNDVDFSQYSAVYVVPVRTASGMPFSPEWNDYRGVVVHDGKVFKNGVTFGQDAWNWGYKVTNHETGHDMGLPEDYNATGSGGTFKFTGDWGVMGNIAAEGPDFFAWEKWKMGWLADSQVACVSAPATVTLSPLATAGGTKMIVVRTGTYTAFIAEVRQRLGVDGNACDKGLLVYKLDASLPNGSGNIRVQDSHPNSGVCGEPLNDAPYDLGAGEVSSFYDAASQTRFEILSAGTDYVVRVTVPSTTVPVWSDDFSTDRGWTVSSTATAGRFERAVPAATSYNGVSYQLSGSSSLVTGPLAGTDAGNYDLDGGITTATSPLITVPASATLSFRYYFAHADNSTSEDYFRVQVNGTTVFSATGASSVRGAAWSTPSVDLAAYAGQQVRIAVEAADLGTGSLLESAVDDVTITAPPVQDSVFADDFATDRGWTVGGPATAGLWARGIPVNTSYSGTACQLSNGTSALVTGLAGGDCAVADVDGGMTSATSPSIALPDATTLRFDFYLAHLNNASSADYLRLRVGSTVLWQRTASASNVSAAWATASVDLAAYAGQTIQLVFEAADNDASSLVEAAIDNINITRS